MTTKLIRGLRNLTPSDQGCAIAIGNFDGVHVGHQALLARLKAQAKSQGVPALVLIFEPQPMEFFTQGQVKVSRLTRLREKFLALQATGVDKVLVLQFDQALANLSAEAFVEEILHKKLHIRSVLIGADFRFGSQRKGDSTLLARLGQKYGFTSEVMPEVMVKGERVSSTRLRQALDQFNANQVSELLGRPYTMLGRVRYGDQLGRKLGFPTANIHVHRALTPVHGIFAVKVRGIGDQVLYGAANVGIRPTVDGTRTLLEVHLLDFNQEIYGCYVEVEFCTKLRDEERYANLELLRVQIEKDVEETRGYFRRP